MIIIANKSGQMCNRIWSYAPFISYGIENNVKIVVLFFGDYANNFQDLNAHASISFIKFKGPRYFWAAKRLIFALSKISNFPLFRKYVYIREFGSQKKLSWNSEVLVKKNALVFVDAWRHKRVLFDISSHRKCLRSIFKPKDVFVAKAKDYVFSIRKDYEVVIGFHIRRGDYKIFADGNYFINDNKTRKLISTIKNSPIFKGRKTAIMLFSNEELAESLYQYEDVFYDSNNEAIVDLECLGLCDYIVGPPSTFSQWASFYGNVPLCWIDPSQCDELNYDNFSPVIGPNLFADGSSYTIEDNRFIKHSKN